jgi:ribonuclease P protein component
MVARPDPAAEGPSLAFSVPRRVGSAVTRNRVRRQLRELLRDAERENRLPAGDYLLIVTPGASDADFVTLRGHIERLVTSVGSG